MAKVGEGDPRWVVQNRDDGRNVNNWHWSETDCTGWAKKYLTTALSDLTVLDDSEQGYCKTKKVQSVSGECTSNIRKGKTIFFYELEAKVSWEAQLKGAEVVKGNATLPYISEECDDDKMEVKISCDSEGPAARQATSLMQAKGIPMIQAKVAEFLKALREEFTVKRTAPPAESALPPFQQKPAPVEQTKPAPVKVSSSKSTIKIKEEFRGSAMDVYKSLTDPGMLNAIMQGSATMNPVEKGTFSFFGGSIVGENVQLVPGSKIVQKWRASTWPEGVYSTVTMKFEEDEGTTTLSLVQEGVPADEVEKTEQGWRQNIWGRAKVMFGFGGMFI